MKKTTLLLLITFVLVACNVQKNAATSSEKNSSNELLLIYTANTRGFFQEIKIENQNVFINENRNATNNQNPIKISQKESQYIENLVLKINLDSLSKLKAPTEKRFYDGAAIANLVVKKQNKTYESADFDNGFPPKELEELVKKITSYAVKE